MKKGQRRDGKSIFYLPASATTADHIKIFAWFGRVAGVDGIHQSLEDEEGGQGAETTAVEAEQT